MEVGSRQEVDRQETPLAVERGRTTSGQGGVSGRAQT